MGAVGGAPETLERFGRQMRIFPVAVSVGAMAGAWARQENAPAGATVVVDHEVSALGRIGREWKVAPGRTLAFATVLRPPLTPEMADACWLVASLGVMGGCASVAGAVCSARWPDEVDDAESGDPVAVTKVEIQLGPGQVKAAVASVRVDLDQVGVSGAGETDRLLEAILTATDEAAASLAGGPEQVAEDYERHCALVGRRVKLRLLPSGEARGTVKGIDRGGGLELASATGMVQRVSVDMLRDLVVV
jgi:BirA family transcriptional regulator, biotin operon repressor / biotin---[acetyl-CoA-carboxylase] ligase